MRPRILLPLLLLLPACGNLKNLHTKAQAERRQKELTKLAEAATSEASGRLGEKAVGEVSYVDDTSGYVLIRARSGLVLADGTELECRGSDAKLRVTPERKSAFVAADIISGAPAKGNAVVVVQSTAKPSLRLVPVNAPPALPGGTEPSGVVTLDSNSLRPDVLPQSTLGGPGGVNAPNFERSPDMAPPEGADILLEPPLPR